MMKSRFTVLISIIILTLLIGCKKDKDMLEFKSAIIGEWKYEYELLSDGTKEYKNPYALLEFEYSDGFLLQENNTGNSVWYDKINGEFEWTNTDSKLILSVTRDDNSIDEFEYQVSDLNDFSMMFESPKGSKYFMKKK